jgi:alkylation response protein AidB-like acyl-CoA dehydrogenase
MRHLTDEQQELQALARSFAEGELRPHTEAWDRDRDLPSEILEALGEVGFMGLRVPEAHGGLELDLPTAAVVVEALSWGESSVGLLAGLHNGPVTDALRRFGTESQQAEWLPALASGSCLGTVGLDEGGDDAGTPLQAIRSSDGGWTLTGEARWVPQGERSGLVLVEARLADAAGADAPPTAFFLVPAGTPGITRTLEPRTLGLTAARPVRLGFAGVTLSSDALLGGESEWASAAGLVRTLGWLFMGAQGVGMAQAALDHAIRYSGEREQFSTPLRSFDGIGEKLAGMALRVAQARALVLDAAAETEAALSEGGAAEGLDRQSALHTATTVEGLVALARIGAGEAATWVADEAVQIFGGYGYMRDYPVEKLMRDAKGPEVFLGTNETLRARVVRTLRGAGAHG